MLTIRLNRVGKKNKAQFRVVLQEHTVAPGGRHVEVLGSYNPHSKEVSLNEEKITYWISKGAQPSDTVHNMLVSKGLIKDEKRKVKIPEKKEENVENSQETKEAPAEASLKEEKPAEDKKKETAEEVKPEAEKIEAKEEEKTEVVAEESAPEKDEEEKKPEEAK